MAALTKWGIHLTGGFFLCAATAFCASTKITYQGQLREQGVPVTASKQIEFRIFSSSIGGAALWTSGLQQVSVTNGLFRRLLEPSGFNWENTLFIELVIDGVTLSPREELTASPFAINSLFFQGKSYASSSSAPSSPASGDLWFDTNSGGLAYWDGSAWTGLADLIADANVAAGAAIQLSKLEKDPSQPGTINTSTNPVDWTQLKGVPASFADGVDNTGGGSPVIEENNVVVEAAASVIDFSGVHFDVTSSPSGEANISLDSATVTLQGNVFNIANGLVQLDVLGQLPVLSGLNLTSLSPSNLLAGALPSNVVTSSVAAGSVEDSSVVGLTAGKLTGALPAISGANLTSLTPGNLSAGLLPANVIVSSLAAGSVVDSAISTLSASKLSGALPAISGASLTSLTPGNLSAGLLPANVIVSSLAAGSVVDSAISTLSASKLSGALPAISGASLTSLTPGNLSAGLLPTNVIVSSLAVGSVVDTAITTLSASKLTGALPAISGASLTSLTPGNLSAGSLPTNVIVSSLAAGSVVDSAIVGVTATKLTGLVPNSSIDTSSVTKLGNVFNGANQLVQLDSAARLLIGSAGTPIATHISTTASVDFAGLALLSCESKVIDVIGARDGDSVALGLPDLLAGVNLTFFTGYVSDDDEVTVRRCALAAVGNPSAVNIRVDVWRH